jgi:hypothetical protein
MTRVSLLGTGLAVFGLAALLWAAPENETKPAPVNVERFHDQLRDVAKGYAKFGRVDPTGRWAPTYCRAPRPAPSISASKDATTHGQKLYFLFVKQREAYLQLSDKPNAVGQVLVKESWAPEEVKDEKTPSEFESVAGKDGKLFRPGKKNELFIMLKLDPKTPDTDEGWVYGTVTPDGKTVTSAGRVESCMSCHKDTKHDRLFGLPKREEKKK